VARELGLVGTWDWKTYTAICRAGTGTYAAFVSTMGRKDVKWRRAAKQLPAVRPALEAFRNAVGECRESTRSVGSLRENALRARLEEVQENCTRYPTSNLSHTRYRWTTRILRYSRSMTNPQLTERVVRWMRPQRNYASRFSASPALTEKHPRSKHPTTRSTDCGTRRCPPPWLACSRPFDVAIPHLSACIFLESYRRPSPLLCEHDGSSHQATSV
jgi:hypothetical protein